MKMSKFSNRGRSGSISSDATHEVKLPQAFAVYSADDQSLSFYKRSGIPSAGEQFEGKTATAMYTGIENMTSAPGWMLNYSKDIKTAIVYDEGISPTDTGFWFAELRNMKTADVSKLDMSKCKTIGCMFTNCSSLTTLDLSGWDTSKVTAMRGMFRNCSKLTTLGDLPSWDTSKVNDMNSMFLGCSKLSVNCSNWDVSKVIDHSNYRSDFNTDAPGVILPLAWQTSSDEGVKDSTIAPLCEEQGNGDALNVSDENGNDEATSKMDGKASADSETEGSTTTSATDEAGAKEETSDDIVQEEPAAA